MATGFNGFPLQALTFLQQVRQQDSKEWFEDHRQTYENQLLTPFRALVETLSITMLQIDDHIETRPAVGKTLSRIHRDTRFSHDKSRYRDKMWFTFKRTPKDWTDSPVYFFELTPTDWRYGLGYYSASRATMELFRQTVRDNPQGFLTVAACLGGEFELVGESYKRPLIKEQPAELAHWYNRKSFAVMATRQDLEPVLSGELASILATGFTQLEPLYHYLMKIEMLKKAAEPEKISPAFMDERWLSR